MPFQSQGVGSGKFEMRLDAKTVQMSLNMISPGQNIGWGKTLEMHEQREQDSGEVLNEFVTGQTGEPELVKWESALQQLLAILRDPAIQSYHMIMHSGASSQVLFSAPEIPSLGYRTFQGSLPVPCVSGIAINGGLLAFNDEL